MGPAFLKYREEFINRTKRPRSLPSSPPTDQDVFLNCQRRKELSPFRYQSNSEACHFVGALPPYQLAAELDLLTSVPTLIK